MDHLDEKARAAMALPLEQRLTVLKTNRWIGYPRAHAILADIEELISHPANARMPNLLVVSRTNNGKTELSLRAVSKNAPVPRLKGDAIKVPVVRAQAPETPTESLFYSAILRAIGQMHSPSARPNELKRQILILFPQLEVKVLIVDEIHNILVGATSKQRTFLQAAKYLTNELRISLVFFGIREAAFALNADEQLANRFEIKTLPKWTLNNDYLQLLASFERIMPLANPSGLATSKQAPELMRLSEGTIGELRKLLVKAAMAGIRSGEERITPEIIRKLDWLPPSKRGGAELNDV